MLNKTLIAILAASIILTGCFKKTPDCGSPDVTVLVKQIAVNAYKESFDSFNSVEVKLALPMYVASLELLPSNDKTNKQKSFLKYIQKMTANNDTFKQTLAEVLNEEKFEVSSIRTNEKKPESKSVKCSAQLKWTTPFADDIVQDINYSAQITDDNKEVYVEVESLQGFDEVFGFED